MDNTREKVQKWDLSQEMAAIFLSMLFGFVVGFVILICKSPEELLRDYYMQGGILVDSLRSIYTSGFCALVWGISRVKPVPSFQNDFTEDW